VAPQKTTASQAGAVYVFTRCASTWSQQAYVKASNTGTNDNFGYSVALSADGNKLATGALGEASNASGIGGLQTDDSTARAGAVYVFTRSASTWSQQAYVKASNAGADDNWLGGCVVSRQQHPATAIISKQQCVGINGNQVTTASATFGLHLLSLQAASGSSGSMPLRVMSTQPGGLPVRLPYHSSPCRLSVRRWLWVQIVPGFTFCRNNLKA
jgi:hypothetical protein